jgi:hypothetical protein
MTIVRSTSCSECGKELTDPLSRRYSIGPDCRADMTPEQLADALRRNQPGYVPKAKPASAKARRTNAAARQAAEPPKEADLCGCGSGAIAGRCPPCNRAERDPMGVLADGVARIIDRIRVERTAERDARYEAWQAAHQPEPEQLTIGA